MLKKRYLLLILIVSLFALSAVSAEDISNDADMIANDYDSGLMAESVDKNLLTDSYSTFEEFQNEIGSVEEGGSINLIAPNITKYYKGSEKFVVTLMDGDYPLANEKITISLVGGSYSRTTNSDGVASMNINLGAGIYDAVVNYKDVSVNSKITVLPTVYGKDIVKIYGDGEGYYATFLDSSGNYLAKNTKVQFNFNNAFYTREIIDNKGNAKLDINENPGSYIITAINPVTNEMSSNNITVLSSGVNNNVNIFVPNVTKYYKESERLYVTLKDKNSQPITNADVKININGITYTKTTNKDGIASMAINLDGGKYDVVTEYGGTKVYSTVVVVDTIIADDFTKIYKNGTQYSGTFFDSQGNLLKNTPVKLNINGVLYTRTTDENGVARMNINLNPGTYILTATNPVNGENHATTIKVLPNIIENKDLTKYYKNASQYVIKLLDDKGHIVGAGETVEFNINGVFYTRTSNAIGQVKLNINLNPGTYIITANYKGLMVSNIIKVLPILEARNLNMKCRDGSKFEAKLLDGKGNPLAGNLVTFNINGVFYDRMTDGNGIARLNINLIGGEYIITSSYNGLNIANTIRITPDPMYYTIGSNPLNYNYYMNEYNKFSLDWYYVNQYESNVKTIYDIYGNMGMELQNVKYGIKYVCYEASTGKEINLNSAGEVISWSYGRGYSEVYIIYDEYNNVIERGRWVYE